MLEFSEFVWALRSSVWDVFNNFLLIDATDRSKISNDQKRFLFALSLYPLSFFANTPFKFVYTSKGFTTIWEGSNDLKLYSLEVCFYQTCKFVFKI